MKNKNQCPKCSSNKILKIIASQRNLQPSSRFIWVPISFMKRKIIYPTSYLCKDCGYLESYIESSKDIDLITKYKDTVKSSL